MLSTTGQPRRTGVQGLDIALLCLCEKPGDRIGDGLPDRPSEKDVKSAPCLGNMPGPARDRSGRAPHPPHGAELANAHHFAALPSPRRVRSSSVEAADRPGVSPRLYGTVQGALRENAASILIETERLFGIGGHRKVTVADIADACGFSPSTSIGISPAAARRSTRLRLATFTRSNAQPLLARSATALRRAIGSVVSSPA